MAANLQRLIGFSAGLTASIIAVNAIDSGSEDILETRWRPLDVLLAKNHLLKLKDEDSLQLQQVRNTLQLQQVQIITRHGARTPFKFIPNYEAATWDEKENADLPHTMIAYSVRTADGGSQPQSAIDNAYLAKDRLKGGSLVGQLTKVGQEQMYQLGKSLKRKYVDELGFISPEFNPDEVYVRTTNILRTVKSVRCVLAGMYGETKLERPIPLITSVNEHEFLYPNYYFCKNLKHWADIAWATADEVPGLKEFSDGLSKQLGVGENDEKLGMIALQDNIRARLAHNFPVPKILMDQLDMIDQFAVKAQLRVIAGNGDSKAILKMSVGNLVENICTQLQDKLTNNCKHKMILYSAHDTTLMALLKSFGVYDNKWPRFASDIRIELYKTNENKWFVKVVYNNQEMKIPGCNSTLCPFEKFLSFVEPYRVKDWDAECGKKGDYSKQTFAIGTI